MLTKAVMCNITRRKLWAIMGNQRLGEVWMIHIVTSSASMCFIVFSFIVPPQGGQILLSGSESEPLEDTSQNASVWWRDVSRCALRRSAASSFTVEWAMLTSRKISTCACLCVKYRSEGQAMREMTDLAQVIVSSVVHTKNFNVGGISFFF